MNIEPVTLDQIRMVAPGVFEAPNGRQHTFCDYSFIEVASPTMLTSAEKIDEEAVKRMPPGYQVAIRSRIRDAGFVLRSDRFCYMVEIQRPLATVAEAVSSVGGEDVFLSFFTSFGSNTDPHPFAAVPSGAIDRDLAEQLSAMGAKLLLIAEQKVAPFVLHALLQARTETVRAYDAATDETDDEALPVVEWIDKQVDDILTAPSLPTNEALVEAAAKFFVMVDKASRG